MSGQTRPGTIDYPYPIHFLSQHTLAHVIDELADPTRIIDIHESESIETALETMYRHGTSALAMYRMITSNGQTSKYEETKREYYCFITMADIVSYLLLRTDLEKLGGMPEHQESQEISLSAMKMPIKDMRGNVSESTKFVIVLSSTTLLNAITTMRGKMVHHIFVCHPVDEDHILEHKFVKSHHGTKGPVVLSQSDIVQFLSKRMSSLGRLPNDLTVEALMQLAFRFSDAYDPNQPVHLAESRWTGSRMKFAVHQPEHYTAINCFKTMLMHHTSAIAIVDDNGHLVETLSMSDFGIVAESTPGLGILFKPVIEMLQEAFEARKRPVFVKRGATLCDVLNAMSENEVHRVWVVENQKPIGCVSMSDILAGMVPLNEPPKTASTLTTAESKKPSALSTMPLEE